MAWITDVPGIEVGQASDFTALTGCSVVLCKNGAVGAVDIRGGAAGTRGTDSLNPGHLVEKVHGVLLAGGSAFGLDATGGVLQWLEEKGIGFEIGPAKIPIVPSAVLFDLWVGDPAQRPDAAMGYQACKNASSSPPQEGSVGAGTGATVGKILGIGHSMKGGVGSWGITLTSGVKVGAFTVVNAWGDVVDPRLGTVVAGARKTRESKEFVNTADLLLKGELPRQSANSSTTLSVVATDARLSKAQAHRVAVMAHDGLARTISPVHTQYDGDVIFVLSTGDRKANPASIGVAAALVVAESVLRAVKAPQ